MTCTATQHTGPSLNCSSQNGLLPPSLFSLLIAVLSQFPRFVWWFHEAQRAGSLRRRPSNVHRQQVCDRSSVCWRVITRVFRFVTEEIKLALIRLYQRFSFKYTPLCCAFVPPFPSAVCSHMHALQADREEPRSAEGCHQNAAATERGRVGHCAPA